MAGKRQEPKATEPKLKIGGKEYPIPTDYTLDEARLIKGMTGMTMYEFEEQMGRDASDPDCIAAFCLVALRRYNPAAQLSDFGEIKLRDIRFVGGDGGPPAGDGTPQPSNASDSTDSGGEQSGTEEPS